MIRWYDLGRRADADEAQDGGMSQQLSCPSYQASYYAITLIQESARFPWNASNLVAASQSRINIPNRQSLPQEYLAANI